MPIIRPSADLRNNYNEISELCNQNDVPIFITKNGRGDLAIMSIATYENLLKKIELYNLIEQGLADEKNNRMRSLVDVIDDIRKEIK